ncbi:MAG: hypothetical protein QM784_16535 [Polyangiaceae bacterium]
MVSIIHAKRDLGRMGEISTVLVRYGFGEFVARLGIGRGRRGRDGNGNSRAPDGTSEDADGNAPVQSEREAFAVRIRKVLEALGPSFIKLGQIRVHSRKISYPQRSF